MYLKLSNKSKKNTCTYGVHVTLRLLVQLYFKTLTGGHLDKSEQWITLTKPTIHVPFFISLLFTFDVSLRIEFCIQCIFYNLETTHSDCAQVHLAKHTVLIFLCPYLFVAAMKHTTTACTVTPVSNVRDHFHQHISWRSMYLRIMMLCSA